jgi:hypothetical protein
MQIFNLPNIIFWTAITITILIEVLTITKRWKHLENHRWTVGYFTVFLLSIPMITFDYWQTASEAWVGLFFSVGIGGILKVGYEQIITTRTAAKIKAAGLKNPLIKDYVAGRLDEDDFTQALRRTISQMEDYAAGRLDEDDFTQTLRSILSHEKLNDRRLDNDEQTEG